MYPLIILTFYYHNIHKDLNYNIIVTKQYTHINYFSTYVCVYVCRCDVALWQGRKAVANCLEVKFINQIKSIHA